MTRPHRSSPKPSSAAKAAKRITKARRAQIERLAAALGEIAPSTARGEGFSVQRVAEQMHLKKYWKKQKNKKADIAHLLEDVIRRYPRKPKTLVLEIVRGGVEWKARKGQRVTKEHLDAIAEPMGALGFRIRKEIEAIEIPEPAFVRPPSGDLVAVFDRLELHPLIGDDVAQMFRHGHLNEAVRKSLERFEAHVRSLTGRTDLHGKGLMARAFKLDGPAIRLNEGISENDRSEQEGFMHLTMGAMAGLRNPLSHGDTAQMTPMDAIERLAFVSMLFKRVDRAMEKSAHDE